MRQAWSGAVRASCFRSSSVRTGCWTCIPCTSRASRCCWRALMPAIWSLREACGRRSTSSSMRATRTEPECAISVVSASATRRAATPVRCSWNAAFTAKLEPGCCAGPVGSLSGRSANPRRCSRIRRASRMAPPGCPPSVRPAGHRRRGCAQQQVSLPRRLAWARGHPECGDPHWRQRRRAGHHALRRLRSRHAFVAAGARRRDGRPLRERGATVTAAPVTASVTLRCSPEARDHEDRASAAQ